MAAPAIIGLIVQAVYNMVDTMFVSWLGASATGATQIVFVIYTAIEQSGVCLELVLQLMLSRLLGKGDEKQASKAVSTVFFYCFYYRYCCYFNYVNMFRPNIENGRSN